MLAERVVALRLDAPVVLALPRGGLPVAAEVAAALGAPFDVVVARKIGAPGRPELAVGAIAEGGEPLFDAGMLHRLGLREEQLQATVSAERRELQRRVDAYRRGRPLPAVTGRAVVLVDDGLATGATARAALRALAAHGASRRVLAVPVAPASAVAELAGDADDVVVVRAPEDFGAVSMFYDAFPQLSDAEVEALLSR
jgi:putative phosphoribosyl transferase